MTEEILKEKFVFYNPWWQEKQVFGDLSLPFKRAVFKNLIDYLSLERIIILKGPRRTGKSTLIYQTIEHLLLTGVKPERILYLNFEDPILRENLHKLFSIFEKISLEQLESKEMKYIFLDEVHLLPEWALGIKAFFDKKYHLKFIVSGSAASLIQKSSESLAGRTIEEIILPFSFSEFVNFQLVKSNKKQEIGIKNYFIFQKQIALYWEKYKKQGGFANLLSLPNLHLLQKFVYEDIIQKVIYKDLVDLYGIREPMVLEKVFYYLIQTSAQILNLSSLSMTLGLNRETLRSYLAYLKRAFLYFELSKFSRSIKQTIGSGSKIYVIDPVFFMLTPAVNQAFIFESIVARHFFQKYGSNLYYWREKEEVDMVLEKENKLIPIEVKSGSKTSKKDLKGVFKFLKRFNQKEGWVVYQGEDKEESFDGIKIKFYSAPKLLFLEF